MAKTITKKYTTMINFCFSIQKKKFLNAKACLLRWLFVFFAYLNFLFWLYKLMNYSLKIEHKLTTNTLRDFAHSAGSSEYKTFIIYLIIIVFFLIHRFEENNDKYTVARNLNWYCYWKSCIARTTYRLTRLRWLPKFAEGS